MRVLTVIQARVGSTRLPGKVLLPLGSGCVLTQMWNRLQGARLKGQLVVATTVLPEDDAIAEVCAANGMACFRGHPSDLLDRHYQVMKVHKADAVVKIPSDCPLVDPAIVDRVIGFYLERSTDYDYVSNLHPQSYPDGNDVEVMNSVSLEAAWRDATRAIDREHTTPFFWGGSRRFRVGNVTWETGADLSASHRWTLDYREDYELIRSVHDALTPGSPFFGVADIVDLLIRCPDIYALNRAYLGDNWYQRHQDELKGANAPFSEVNL